MSLCGGNESSRVTPESVLSSRPVSCMIPNCIVPKSYLASPIAIAVIPLSFVFVYPRRLIAYCCCRQRKQKRGDVQANETNERPAPPVLRTFLRAFSISCSQSLCE
jgi:hypothetical protein